MKTCCLINNYNYGSFIAETIESCLAQTIPFDEIIIVDDGSTDDSVRIIQEKFSNNAQIQLIQKKNEGQLSCFNEGFARSKADLICFLDSDDLLKTNYLEEILKFYKNNNDCDFLFFAYENFGLINQLIAPYSQDEDLGLSKIITLFSFASVGNIMALAIKREVLEKVLPLPLLKDWITAADSCLTWACSLTGAHKYYLNKCLLKRRIHGNNDSLQKNTNQNHFDRIENLFLYLIQEDNELEPIMIRYFKELQSKPNLGNLFIKLKDFAKIMNKFLIESNSLKIKFKIKRFIQFTLAYFFPKFYHHYLHKLLAKLTLN